MHVKGWETAHRNCERRGGAFWSREAIKKWIPGVIDKWDNGEEESKQDKEQGEQWRRKWKNRGRNREKQLKWSTVLCNT